MQQEVRDAILAAFPELEPDDVRSTIMGGSGEDIQLSPAARKFLSGTQWECKRVKTLKTVYSWVAQARTHGPHKPVVVTRQDRSEALVIIPLTDYIELLRSLK